MRGEPRLLFDNGSDALGVGVAPDGQRFLRLVPDPTVPAASITLLTRWRASLPYTASSIP